MPVNHRVRGSNPCWGAKNINREPPKAAGRSYNEGKQDTQRALLPLFCRRVSLNLDTEDVSAVLMRESAAQEETGGIRPFAIALSSESFRSPFSKQSGLATCLRLERQNSRPKGNAKVAHGVVRPQVGILFPEHRPSAGAFANEIHTRQTRRRLFRNIA